ncbi:unnamed protein product [Macrosiphum euphorbiae]|uniref:Uncharacterized protein n=1 Tax=Macrosiphum euphorbiae TaxID=13131 RepID=A0AAV0XW56_9HEMI|nr:unnamed protein product [Macrosiphum euphorbiae]
MLRTNLNVSQGLVNGAIVNMTEINWPNFVRDQLYDECIPTSIRVDFGRDGIHKIEPISSHFPAMRSYGTAERKMLPIIFVMGSNRTQVTGLHRRSCYRLSWTKALCKRTSLSYS